MRTSVTAVVLGAVAALVGGWLVARWCLGVVVITEAAAAVAWGLLRDDGQEQPRAIPGSGVTLAEVWDRARRAA